MHIIAINFVIADLVLFKIKSCWNRLFLRKIRNLKSDSSQTAVHGKKRETPCGRSIIHFLEIHGNDDKLQNIL